MSIKTTLLATAAALLPIAGAGAQTADWTGFYAGVHFGVAGGGDSELSVPGSTGVIALSNGGVFGGVQAGFDYQVGSVVLGVVADIDLSDIEAELDAGAPTSTRITTSYDWLATLRARAGALLTDDVLLYAHGGLALGDIELEIASGGTSASDSATRLGWTLGAGVEIKVAEAVSIGTEYGYYAFGEEEYDLAEGAVVGDLDNDFHALRLGVNYHFGAGGERAATPSYNWTGFYVGASFGTGGGTSDIGVEGSGTVSLTSGGVLAGIHGGFDFQLGQFVIGAGVDFGFSDVEAEIRLGGESVTVSQEWLGSAQARAGFLVTDALLAYGHGGVALADITMSQPSTGSDSVVRSGWTAGAGVEARVTDSLSIGTEYGYYDFGSDDYDIGSGTEFELEEDFHTLRVKANFRF